MTHHEHPNVTRVKQGFEAMSTGDPASMNEYISEDVIWHVGGNSKWAGSYEGLAAVMEMFGRQMQAMGGNMPEIEVHDMLGNDDHVVSIGTAKATAADGSSAEWNWVQVFHIKDGKATEVWGLAENDAAVDPFLDALPG